MFASLLIIFVATVINRQRDHEFNEMEHVNNGIYSTRCGENKNRLKFSMITTLVKLKKKNELFRFKTKFVEKERPSRPVCTEEVHPQTRERLEHEIDFQDVISNLDEQIRAKEKPPPTLPKPKRRIKRR